MGANQALVDTLLATFSSLPIEERIVLELLSVHYDPLISSKALNLVNLASKRNVSVKPLGLPTWKRLSKKLRTAGLLQGRAGTIQCNSKIVDAITRNALGEGRLNTHLQVLYEYRPDMDPENSLYGVNYTYDGILAKLRLAVHTNDVEGFVFIREDWYGRGWYLGVAPFAWEQRLFGHPLDVGWLQTREPLICYEAIYRLVQDAHEKLLTADHLSGVLGDAASELSPGQALRALAIEHALLCGNFEAAERWLHGDTTAGAELYRGWLCSVRGQRENAAAHFESGMVMVRKSERKREVILAGLLGPLYVLGLISTGERPRLSAAHNYVDKALRESEVPPLHEALRCAILLAEGKVEVAKAAVGNIDRSSVSELIPLDALFVYIAFCWCDDGAARTFHKEIRALENRAARAG